MWFFDLVFISSVNDFPHLMTGMVSLAFLQTFSKRMSRSIPKNKETLKYINNANSQFRETTFFNSKLFTYHYDDHKS